MRLACSQEGCTALLLASMKGEIEAIKLLLAAGADVHAEANVRALLCVVCDRFTLTGARWVSGERGDGCACVSRARRTARPPP